MFILPNLYVAGTRYGWRKLRGIWGSTRKELGVSKSQSPLSAVRRGAHDAPTTRKGQCEDADKPDDNRCIQHLFEGRYCGEAAANGVVRLCGCAAKVRLRCG